MQTTAWPFIEMDERGRPLIQGTRYKVLLLVEEHRLYDWDAEQLRRQHPDLSLPQLHAALGFYYDHQADCDRMLEERERELDEWRAKTENPALQERLRRLKEGA